jgi:hypothetical protein
MASTSAVVIPKVVKFGFMDFKVGKKSAILSCASFAKRKRLLQKRSGLHQISYDIWAVYTMQSK